MSEDYHTPVMLQECIDGLQINPDGVYVDVTFGGGGHAKAILDKLENGCLYVFDQDADAVRNFEKLQKSLPNNPKKKIVLIEANFRLLKKYLRLHDVAKVDGIIADLGVSSHQFDTAERGFSFRFDAVLDMRMNKNSTLNAKNIINEYSEQDLQNVFGKYGEIHNAKTLAVEVANARANTEIKTTGELKKIAIKLAKRGHENKYLAQMFQALRIEVNDEMKALEEMLLQAADVLNSGGKLVVLTYHSLEDRPVKNFIKHGKFTGEAEKDVFGNTSVPFESITRKPVEATEEETMRNPRARSAKLRIAIRH